MIRPLSALAVLSALAACAQQPYEMNDADSAKLTEALSGKVAGESEDCLPLDSSRNPDVVDDRNILFRVGRTTWLNRPEMRCALLDSPNTVLVIEPRPGGRLCRNDLIKVADSSTLQVMSSCALGDFTPYRDAG